MTRDQTWTNADGLTVGYGKHSPKTDAGPTSDAVNWHTDGSEYNLMRPDGSVIALSEAVAVVALTATGTAFSGACEYRGFVVRAISGTPQTITVYDATSATGTPIMTVSVTDLGTYYWDGDHATAGNGSGARRVCGTGCHVVISGGTSRTIDVMVE